MSEEIIVLNPDRLGYKDRGILKWQGMIMSEQREALNKIERTQNSIERLTPDHMTEELISEHIFKSLVNKAPIALQANVISNGSLVPEVICITEGYKNGNIYFSTKDRKPFKLKLEEIRSVAFYDPYAWNQKYRSRQTL